MQTESRATTGEKQSGADDSREALDGLALAMRQVLLPLDELLELEARCHANTATHEEQVRQMRSSADKRRRLIAHAQHEKGRQREQKMSDTGGTGDRGVNAEAIKAREGYALREWRRRRVAVCSGISSCGIWDKGPLVSEYVNIAGAA